jgi:hypothetical protein
MDLFRGMRYYATRSKRLELCSIETGVASILSRLFVNRMRGLASLRKARRNTSMKNTAAPQLTLMQIIRSHQDEEQGKGQARDQPRTQ